jgi:hypothetical protein
MPKLQQPGQRRGIPMRSMYPKQTQIDPRYIAARMIVWYNKHQVREVSTNDMIKHCKKFAHLYGSNPKNILNELIDNKFVLPQGSESYEINKDA